MYFLRKWCLNLFTLYFYDKPWTPLGAPVLIRGSKFEQLRIKTILGRLHCNSTTFKRCFNILLLIWIWKLESHLEPKYWSRDHDFINLKYTFYDDACIVISLNCGIAVFEKNLKKKYLYISVKKWSFCKDPILINDSY